MCNFQKYTKMDYLVFLFLLSKIQHRDEFGNLTVRFNDSIQITADEFATLFSIDISNSYKALRLAITSLQTKLIQFRDLFDTDTQYTLITKSSFYKTGRAVINFNPEILHHIANLANNFTQYKIANIAKLDTLPAIRLFELLIQFKKSGVMFDTLENVKFSLSKDTITEYKIFKRDVLKPAIEELNTKHKQLNVVLVEHKENKQVARLEFTFTPTATKTRQTVITTPNQNQELDLK